MQIVWQLVCRFLTTPELIRLERVSGSMYNVVFAHPVWRQKCKLSTIVIPKRYSIYTSRKLACGYYRLKLINILMEK